MISREEYSLHTSNYINIKINQLVSLQLFVWSIALYAGNRNPLSVGKGLKPSRCDATDGH